MLLEIGNWLAPDAPSFISSVATVTIAIVAVLSFRKWHKQTVGKRKIELAEDILADIYRVKDVFIWARFPVGYSDESSARLRDERESEGDSSMKDAYFRTVARLDKEGELFSRLQSKKYRSMAFYGKHTGQYFDDIKAIHSRIVTSAEMLINHHNSMTYDEIKEWKKVIWHHGKNKEDDIYLEIDRIIGRFENEFSRWLLVKNENTR